MFTPSFFKLQNKFQKPKISKSKYELSLAEFPIFNLSKDPLIKQRKPYNQPYVYQDQIIGKDHIKVQRIWNVWPDSQYGHGSPSTLSTFFDLFQIWSEKNFENEYVHFGSLYNLAKKRGVIRSMNFYRQLRRDLSCLVGIKIVAQNAFWDNESKCYVDKEFHLFDEISIYKEGTGGQMVLPLCWIKASDVLYGSVLANSILTMNFDPKFFHSLTPVEKRLALYLSKMFRSQYIHKREIFTLASQIPLKIKEKKLIKQRLKKACTGLSQKGFQLLESFRFQKGDSGKEFIVFYRRGNQSSPFFNPFTKQDFQQTPTPQKDPSDVNLLIDDILQICQDRTSYGFYKKVARLMSNQDIYRALSEVKQIRDTGTIKKSKGAIFTNLIKKYAREQGINI